MERVQTAVEWLAEQLKKQGFLYDLDIEAAKQMEKEQKIEFADRYADDVKVMKQKILDIIEFALKDNGKSFSNEEIAELLQIIFDEESKKVFDRGWQIGYDRGVRDEQTPSGW